MSKQFTIKPMTIEDYDGLHALWMTIHGFGIRSIDDSREGVARFLKRNPTTSMTAWDGDTLIGLAGASADCETMYQIGIDVLPEYRRQRIAAALTSRLTEEILALGKVPFYCAAWSNIRSVKNAITCGYRPAWVELTARERSFVEQCNTQQK